MGGQTGGAVDVEAVAPSSAQEFSPHCIICGEAINLLFSWQGGRIRL